MKARQDEITEEWRGKCCTVEDKFGSTKQVSVLSLYCTAGNIEQSDCLAPLLGGYDWDSLDTKLPEFQYGGATYTGATLLHLLVLKEDIKQLRKRCNKITEECVGRTCEMRQRGRPVIQVTPVSLACAGDATDVLNLLGVKALNSKLPKYCDGGYNFTSATFLHWLAFNNKVEYVRSHMDELVPDCLNATCENFFDKSCGSFSVEKFTPLCMATERGSVDMALLLIEAKADPNIPLHYQHNSSNSVVVRSPLFYAAKNCLLRVCKKLLENGAIQGMGESPRKIEGLDQEILALLDKYSEDSQ